MADKSIHRITKGAIASWARLLVNISSQLTLVPVLLSKWNSNEYGIWLLYLSFCAITQVLDFGNQEYFTIVWLNCNPDEKDRIKKTLQDSIVTGTTIAIVTFLSVLFGCLLFIKTETQPAKEIATLILIHNTFWLVFGALGGLPSRALLIFGYFSRFAWWSIAGAIANLAATIASVSELNQNLIGTCVIIEITSAILSILTVSDAIILLKKHGIDTSTASLRTAKLKLRGTIIMASTQTLEILRQHGSRIILADILSVGIVAQFSTLRTVANILQQGILSTTQPMVPELATAISRRQNEKFKRLISGQWTIILGILIPLCALLQITAPTIFRYWTHGKIDFDRITFSYFSVGILISAVSQPAIAVVKSSNRVKFQLKSAAVSVGISVISMLILTPRFEAAGAAASVLLGEVFSLIVNTKYAIRASKERGTEWPLQKMNISYGTIGLLSVTMLAITATGNINFRTMIPLIAIPPLALLLRLRNRKK